MLQKTILAFFAPSSLFKREVKLIQNRKLFPIPPKIGKCMKLRLFIIFYLAFINESGETGTPPG